ncbi:hypothetical protein OBBRIDRAFT_496834 [Obba rivulosa]|uniref:Uncharacterized protein n=1 Tax=Obba rivulosa TaxID=1052685 RepID=A0A8E2DU25_9APHY|nr:hypothetical protein OBBRIDRAFT_496834 [Obba rivulosa]
MSFFDRTGQHQFRPPTSVWGYLPQVNEWACGTIYWRVTRVGGEDHIPVFECVPIWNGEPLEQFTALGHRKKAAMESAAEAVALSGHCVSIFREVVAQCDH